VIGSGGKIEVLTLQPSLSSLGNIGMRKFWTEYGFVFGGSLYDVLTFNEKGPQFEPSSCKG